MLVLVAGGAGGRPPKAERVEQLNRGAGDKLVS